MTDNNFIKFFFYPPVMNNVDENFQFKYCETRAENKEEIDVIIQSKNTTHCFIWFANSFLEYKMKRI